MSYGPAPESAEHAHAWLDQHDRQFELFINNEWQAPESGAYMPAVNPANGQTLAQVANANADDVARAVSSARAAFESWRDTSPHSRARYLYAIARNVQKHQRLLAVLETLDNGKPIRESRDLDVPLVARHFYHHAGWAQLMAAEMADYQPLGVVGQIIPWNFPLLMLAWKIAPALATGNTVVLKPAPQTNLTALLFAQIIREAGLPAGVVNIITGDDQAGIAITEHPDIDKIAFTGSTAVGRVIRRATAGSGKKLSLELGGKSPYVVFDDADTDAAIEGLVDAIWFNQGQVCCAGSRLLVQENIAPEFLDNLRRRMGRLRVGDPLDKAIDIGAIIDAHQHQTISEWVERGRAEGCAVFQPEVTLPAEGCFYPPTLLTDAAPSSSVAQEEIFGPVLVAMTFRTPAEAVALANNTRYGLAASVWSENVNLALDVARKIKAGSVWVNCTNLFDAAAGFGGYRESGYGREGGREGLFEYLRPTWQKRPSAKPKAKPAAPDDQPPAPHGGSDTPSDTIDRTAKLYIGGKQKRPDGGYTRAVHGADGLLIGQVGDGNRKDIRDAVAAARSAAAGWAKRTGHNRAQILYYLAENLAVRGDEFARRLSAMTGATLKQARAEVDLSIERLFIAAAYADKYGGTVQETELRGITMALNEPLGVVGIACPDEAPLLAFVSLIVPAIGRGNSVIVIPSPRYPLSATDFYQVLETSDIPAGVVNIVTGERETLARTLAEHDDVDAMWYFGTSEGAAMVEAASAGNMKRTWTHGAALDWTDAAVGAGDQFLQQATQVKNIWVPTGE